MGKEFAKKGVNVILGPVVGPIGRTMTGGRLWEYSGSDPYLAGVIAAQTIQGAGSVGVQSCVKVSKKGG